MWLLFLVSLSPASISNIFYQFGTRKYFNNPAKGNPTLSTGLLFFSRSKTPNNLTPNAKFLMGSALISIACVLPSASSVTHHPHRQHRHHHQHHYKNHQQHHHRHHFYHRRTTTYTIFPNTKNKVLTTLICTNLNNYLVTVNRIIHVNIEHFQNSNRIFVFAHRQPVCVLLYC